MLYSYTFAYNRNRLVCFNLEDFWRNKCLVTGSVSDEAYIFLVLFLTRSGLREMQKTLHLAMITACTSNHDIC